MAPRPKITLYVDTVSPFAYAAYYLLRHDPVFRDCEVEYVPIFLGGLMHKCGNTPPIKIKNKDRWIASERLRWAILFSIPMSTSLPPDFPAPTLPVGRALAVLQSLNPNNKADAGQKDLVRALDALFTAHWVEGQATHRPEVLRGVLAGLYGAGEADKILAEAATTGKQRLVENTERAFGDGAFGLPWMVCTNGEGKTEGFWGVDHIGQVVEFLGLDRSKGLGKAGWRAVL